MKGLDWFRATDAAATPIAGAVAAGCLFVWLATLAFAFQGARGLWDPDEGRYAIVALNMVDSGDYLVPRISNDHPHYAKPPLAYWAMAASMRGLGATEFAVRLPNAVAFLLTGLVLTWMARMLSQQRPWTATVIWATTLLPFVASNVATTDTMLAFFETLAVAGYCALRWDLRSSRQQVGRRLMWIAFGCGFLTKGPPALLPLLAMIVFERFALRPRPAVSLYAPAPMIVALSIGLSWFLLTVARDSSLVRYFLLDEFVYRVATDMHERNPGFVGLIKRTCQPSSSARYRGRRWHCGMRCASPAAHCQRLPHHVIPT
jgi:4-amino-4-deoxy-L-arabinose transferase